ncbi:hypothetical protein H6S82_21250 [Planktothrix sp. FACHB-1355]|uniref:Core-binding (CB) domain-containing protein n=1 Tax=Aerosakkonema funiforme FACHB-1375 TaxID=2949571 RepID=A0A926VCV9_9CYAN|nr:MULTISPECIES: hypothetical protein [Oscillatoriales]MBD2181053.1 hypothetical protein [Aerosakkonema funiforme FACHB-1375]MBD3561347.1 hypothetical protein [Planktothrix sp. FACHB-1355]
MLKYKLRLVEQNLKEATINRKLAAIKALVRYDAQIGKFSFLRVLKQNYTRHCVLGIYLWFGYHRSEDR